MLGRFQELGLKVAFTDVNAVAQPAEPKPSYFAVRDATGHYVVDVAEFPEWCWALCAWAMWPPID